MLAFSASRILKFEIDLTASAASRPTRLPLPLDAQFRHAAEQHGRLAVWYEVPEQRGSAIALGEALAANQAISSRAITVIATGEPFEPAHAGRYLATVLMAGGRLVWHLYERGGEAEPREKETKL